MSISNRLDKIENEIRHLLDNQKKKIKRKVQVETFCWSHPVSENSERRRRSLSVPSNSTCNALSEGTKSISTKQTRSRSTTMSSLSRKTPLAIAFERNCADCCTDQKRPKSPISVEGKCCCCNKRMQISAHNTPCYSCCIKKKLTLEIERNKLLESEVAKLRDLVAENRKQGTQLSKKWKTKYKNLKKDCKCDCGVEAEKQRKCWDLDRARLNEALETISKYEKQLLHNKNVSEKYEKLLKSLAEKNKRIEKFEKDLQDKDGMINSMCARCKELENALSLIRQKYQDLLNTNEKLATNVINKNNSLEAAKKETRTELLHYKAEAEKFKEEVMSLREELSNASQLSINQQLLHKERVSDLETNLKEAKKREKYNNKLVAILEEKVNNLERAHSVVKDNCSVKIETMTKEQDMLQKKCDSLTEQLMEIKDLSAKRVKSLQSELESFKTCSCSREEDMAMEKFELKNLIQELSTIVSNQKLRIEEMVKYRNEREEVINARNEEIKSKEVRIKTLESESTSLRKKCDSLEEEIKDLKESYNNKLCNCKDSKPTLEKEIKKLRESLDIEQDKFQIKEKILDDQTNTVMQLKRKLAEKDDQVAALYRELNTEKSEKNALNTKLKQLQKDNLSQTHDISRLENENAMQKSLLDNLERKFELKIKEWKLESELSLAEKEQAIKAAKFTTQQLIQSMQDFEEQSQVQHKIRVLLTSLLQEKDSKLRAAILQMSSLTLEPNTFREAINNLSQPKKISKETFLTPRNSELLMKSVQPYEISPSHISVDEDVNSLNDDNETVECGEEITEEAFRKVMLASANESPRTFEEVEEDNDSTNTLIGVEGIQEDDRCTCVYRNNRFVCSPNCTKYSNQNKVRKK